ncbi:unnamed protein product [Paramecium sonneborni]|uniref:Uncharacterized protein n=1 Tax=Paramecium sonneborni TaxID=65129 RepID=A0A8S1M166_9CILI|nr:unnamed protein product [Paramecium sonneborni]
MFGKNIYQDEVPNFPEVSEDYFDIKDQKTIKELMDLYNQSKQLLPVNGQVSNQFREKQLGLLNLFDKLDSQLKSNQCKPDIYEPIQFDSSINTPFHNFDYYNLSDINYDQTEAQIEAAKFLSMKQNDLQEKFEQMQIEAKQSGKQNQPGKLTKKMELLSFQDQDQIIHQSFSLINLTIQRDKSTIQLRFRTEFYLHNWKIIKQEEIITFKLKNLLMKSLFVNGMKNLLNLSNFFETLIHVQKMKQFIL